MKSGLQKKAEIKCVIWDLDGTLWDGSLLEDKEVILKPRIAEIIKILDSRGILHSIASRNSYNDAKQKIEEYNLWDYFLYPEINWGAKSLSVECIQKNLNIAMNAIMFIDDQQYERDEIQSVHPEILCVDASEYLTLPDYSGLNPKCITDDSQRRRHLYLQDMQRKRDEEKFIGPKKEFLSSLKMEFVISSAMEEDLKRAEELTVRTNQLNTTGITYNYEELKRFCYSRNHTLLLCELKDKYGSYGKIGLALIEMQKKFWHLRLILMSCRVMARGLGTVFLSYIMQQAKKEGKKLRADFKKTDRNRMMFIAFKFANFRVVKTDNSTHLTLENDLSFIQQIPHYIKLIENVSERGAHANTSESQKVY